ncbi:MAG: fumarylacetoacetate hydrolase family protein, partial [Alishewanella sp.]|nr:fumarylacetoacetate hydrolase family protein [Alishewanella sp.]
QQGRPWEIAKGFDGACPLSGFVPKKQVQHPQQLDFSLSVNQQLRQQGNSANMIRGINQLISEMTQHFTLLPGDVVLTGTPAGVGPLQEGDVLTLELADFFSITTQVTA